MYFTVREMNSKFTLILGLGLIFITLGQIGAGEEKKKLKLVLDKLEKLKETEHIVNTELTFDRDGDSNEIVVNGHLEISVDVGDNYRLTFDILHSDEQNGDMKMVIRVANKGVCEILKNQYKIYFYESLKKHCNAPDPEKCPVAKDKFEVNKYPLDSSKFANYLRPGFYNVIFTLRHNDEEVLQYRLETHTEEQ